MDIVAYLPAIGTAVIDNAPFLVGFIMPPIVEVFVRDIPNSKGRLIVSLLLSFLAAVWIHWHQIAIGDPEQILVISGAIFTESQAMYNLYFKDSMLRYAIQNKVDSRVERQIEFVDEEEEEEGRFDTPVVQ